MYYPDSGFVKKMKSIARNLVCKWNAHSERFQIFEVLKEAVPVCEIDGKQLKVIKEVQSYVMTVQNDDGTFRPLDDRTVRWLKFCQKFNNESREAVLKLFEDQDKQKERDWISKRNEMAEKFSDVGTYYRFGNLDGNATLKMVY